MKNTSRENLFGIALVALSIIILVLMTYGWHFFVWIHLVPLIYIAYRRKLKQVILFGLLYSIISSFFVFDWIIDKNLENSGKMYFSIAVIFTVFVTSFLALTSIFSKKINRKFLFLLPPVIWALMLLAYSWLPLKILWQDYSLFQPDTAPLIWIFGSFGITFAIFTFNSLLAQYFYLKEKRILYISFALFLLVAASILYSNFHVFSAETKLKIALIQGNFPYSWEERNKDAFGRILDSYVNLTKEASFSKPDMVIWPEYAISDDIFTDEYTFSLLRNLAQNLNTTLIIGTLRYVDNDHYYDTSAIFSNNGQVSTYDSISPIIFEPNALRSTNENIIKFKEGNFGISMCNEELIAPLARKSSAKSGFLISLSNNQYFNRGRLIISQFSKLRAAENGKYIARATNDGITQIVNPAGKVVATLDIGKQNILIGEIYINNEQTFYNRFGNLPLFFVLLLSILLLQKRPNEDRRK